MNLTKLFEIQKQLDNRIVEKHNLQGEDLLPKKILALQVELGELANEWRRFKFWSNDQEPRYETVEIHVHGYDGPGQNTRASIQEFQRNPLLEEYVDCLHFILSIGLELELSHKITSLPGIYPEDIEVLFIELIYRPSELYFYSLSGIDNTTGRELYQDLFDTFLHLGKRLGFTWEQIEQAYLEKNAENHNRQDRGY